MKFKTRLKVTLAAIILVPLVLIVAAFILIALFISRNGGQYGLRIKDYRTFMEVTQPVGEPTETLFDEIVDAYTKDSTILGNIDYLESLEIKSSTTFIMVRKGEGIYYSTNEEAARELLDKLPVTSPYDGDDNNGYYFNADRKYVKQLDFIFEDGTPGSFFVVSAVNHLVSRSFMFSMLVAIFCILFFTGIFLTQWIHRGVFKPITELNVAMKKIKEGDFDYVLSDDSEGEIGDLYRSYEDMRLRLKESAEEKMEQEQQNRELISNISHDLKTPITAIKGYMEGIMDGVADTPEKMDKYIRTVYNKANDMDRLINELTIYAGIDSNRIPYNFHRIKVVDYFRDCVEEVGLDLEAKNIKLNYSSLVDPSVRIIADPEQLKRVINNIISNSVKYMEKDNPEIDIRILDEVDSIRVEIEDNGRGIAPKDLPRIFERFYRTDSSRNSLKGGSGIGLSIVKKIIEDHGGYIWATSKEGEGTCMHFVIRKYRELQSEPAVDSEV